MSPIGRSIAASCAMVAVFLGLDLALSAEAVSVVRLPRPKLVYEGAFVIPTPDKLAAVAISPDGSRLAVSHGDRDDRGRYVDKISLVDTWHPRRSKVVLVTDEVRAVAWSPDGRALAVCSASSLTILRGLDPWFHTRIVQTLPLELTDPVLFSAKGDWLLAQGAKVGDHGFVCVRFAKIPNVESMPVDLDNNLPASLIRYPGDRIAIVGRGVAVDRQGKTYSIKPTGTVGLYSVHSNLIAAGPWFVAFDMDDVSHGNSDVSEITGTRAWMENVLTGKKIKLRWSKSVRVSWVQAFGTSSICVQANDEALLRGPRDRFRRYRLDWSAK